MAGIGGMIFGIVATGGAGVFGIQGATQTEIQFTCCICCQLVLGSTGGE
jgi:hypothetical protein